ncbi:MAG TPA: acetylornithine/succinylornithine family transaminase [Terriglobia bacterium]|nr:acetylornithine/succinylornithine family transaminase [Terriglobia bacterium]
MARKAQTGTPPISAAQARRDAERYLMNTYKRPALVLVRGKGCRLYDDKGREYLDFLGGIAVNALGHAHPRLVRVIRREAARATHLSNLFHNEFQGPLAKKLARWSGMDRVFFTNSGTEAVEGALKLARIRAKQSDGGKTRILALENSFHGRTFGALSITATEKYRAPFAPLVPGIEFVRFNDVADLELKFDSSVCALVVEPIQGEGGIHAVSEAFWTRARQLANQYNAALIADEIQCGLGRTGRYFAYQRFKGLPDIVVLAKPLGGGLPLGALLARESFASAFSPGLHGTTFGGGPLVCAVALEFLQTVEDERLLENVRRRGGQIRAGLERLRAKFDFIKEIRGEGLILGLELSVAGAPYVAEALRRGLVINCTHDYTLRFLPPFIVREREVNEFLDKLDTIFGKTRKA